MQALLICGTSGMYIVCPHCKSVISDDEIENDDYVGGNCLFWCPNDRCGEVMICPTGYNSSDKIIDDIIEGVVEDGCTQKITREEALKFVSDGNELLKIDQDIGTEFYYLVGVLRITHIVSSCEINPKRNKNEAEESDDEFFDETDSDPNFISKMRPYYHKVNITRFSDAKVDTSHDGIYLYYKGFCDFCKKEYESYIWGD